MRNNLSSSFIIQSDEKAQDYDYIGGNINIHILRFLAQGNLFFGLLFHPHPLVQSPDTVALIQIFHGVKMSQSQNTVGSHCLETRTVTREMDQSSTFQSCPW